MNFENKNNKILDDAIMNLAILPGIGRKTALRFALFLQRKDEETIKRFTESIVKLKTELKFCPICHNISDNDHCNVCSDVRRNKSIICVVENINDVMAIEATSQFNGLYHVLGGLISPLEGISPSDLNIKSLIDRINMDSNVNEIILALPATMEGDTTNYYINRKINHDKILVSILARGIAIGDELQYTDEITLGQSIINRKVFQK